MNDSANISNEMQLQTSWDITTLNMNL